MRIKGIKNILMCGTILLLGIGITNITIHAKTNQKIRNTKITHKVTNFAKTRQSEYYPQITYNTRDLGGYWNTNHTAQVRKGMLYRSANLHFLKRRGANEIKRLHIKTDIDLRNQTGPNSSINSKPSPGEIKTFKDPYKLHLKYINNPVETGQQEAYSWPYRKKYGEIYRFGYWYTTSPTARRAYHNSLYDMLKDTTHHNAVLYDCNSGRDRTGVLSAITLSILGIPKNTIYNDFLLSNYYHYQNPYVNQNARLTRFYHTVQKNYGNMNNYLTKGLYLSPKFLNKFRKHFLIIVRNKHNKKPIKIIKNKKIIRNKKQVHKIIRRINRHKKQYDSTYQINAPIKISYISL